MVIDRAAAGRGVGAELINHAVRLAHRHGRDRLVLDAWTSNDGLHEYYQSQGFRYVRTVPGHWTPSAALFERAVKATTTTGNRSAYMVAGEGPLSWIADPPLSRESPRAHGHPSRCAH